jgi:hypothetical protein
VACDLAGGDCGGWECQLLSAVVGVVAVVVVYFVTIRYHSCHDQSSILLVRITESDTPCDVYFSVLY